MPLYFLEYTMKKWLLISTFLIFNANAYDRNEYGAWKDLDSDCKNTRIEVLEKYSIAPPKIYNCNSIIGKWIDYYTGLEYNTSSILDIDHIIPLKYVDSRIKLNNADKITMANDIDNLLPTTKHINRSKGSKSLYQWLPPNQKFRCEYISKWIMISNKYGFSLLEKDMKVIKDYSLICNFKETKHEH